MPKWISIYKKREAGLTACIYYKICLTIIICIKYTIKTAWYMFVQMNNWSTSVDAHWMYPFSTICFEVIPVACRILNNWTPEICILGSHNVIPSAPGSYWIILNMFLNHGFITHLTFSLYYDSLADGNKHDFETVVIQTSQFRGHNVLITNFRAYFVMNFFLQKDMLPQKQDCDFLTGWKHRLYLQM